MKAICYTCEKLVATTQKLRDVPTSTGKVVPNLLVGVCDICDSTVSCSQASVATLKDYFESIR